MSDEELLDVEVERSADEVAASLRAIADDLESGDTVTVDVAGQSVTVDGPADTLEYEVEVEREPADGGDEIEVELELEWIVAPARDVGEAATEPDVDDATGADEDAEEGGEADGADDDVAERTEDEAATGVEADDDDVESEDDELSIG